MASSSTRLHIIDDEDEFDWEAAVRAIDVACQATADEKSTSISNFNSSFNCNPQNFLDPAQGVQKKGRFDAVSSTRQTTLDKFIGVSSSISKKSVEKAELSNGLRSNNSSGNNIVYNNGGGVAECEDIEMLNGFMKIDPEAAKTWIYPVNFPGRDYQFSITRTALFSNTLVVLPTGLGKTLIAAVVMYNFFRWFPEGKIVFAAPSRPLVMQQIEACHNIVGIPQEWTIDLTGQTNPKTRAEFWKDRRVFFVTPQVLEKDIHSGSCLVKHLVCLVIDEAHRATGNYSYCVAVRELMDTPVQLRILALTATPGCKQQTIQHVIDNLHISTLEYRNESDPDVLPYVHERKIELIEVAMGDEAVEIDNLLLEVTRPFVARLSAFGLLQRDFQTRRQMPELSTTAPSLNVYSSLKPRIRNLQLSPCELLNSRDKFRQVPPQDLPHTKYGEVEGYFGVLITLCHVRKLLSSHGIKPAFETLVEKLKLGYFARLMSKNEVLLKAKLLMQQTVSHGAPSPKLAKMLEVLADHFKFKDPKNSRVIIFSNYRDSVRDILDALTNIGGFVKATEFIGQSSGVLLNSPYPLSSYLPHLMHLGSNGKLETLTGLFLFVSKTRGFNEILTGKTSKGQSQKVQQAVLQKFRTGGYNVIVATSIGEEGLDIMEVDLVICFDANVSPLRMIQRMGSELKGYKRKQANGKAINKHMRNGGMNSFNFHSSPRMVPHVFKPEVQFLEMSIEEFVPRGKKVKDFNTVSEPAYKTKLTNAETDLLAKYFPSSGKIAWRPSLIAFPHFQGLPSPVHKVVHSSRTGILIDTMQNLQGSTFSKDIKTLSAEDEDILDPSFRVEAVGPEDEIMEERFNDPAEGKLKKEIEIDTEVEEIAKDMHIEDFHKQKPCLHTLLFGSEFVSVDDVGNVLVLSLPQLPLESNFKHIEGGSMASAYHLMHDSEDHEENTVQGKGNPSSCSRLPEENLLESSLRNLDAQKGKLLSEAEEILLTPVSSRMPKEIDVSGEDHKFVHNRKLPSADESSDDFRDSELSPRLTNFIKSGIVPESPVHNSGTWKHDENTLQDGSLGKMGVPCSSDNDMQTLLHCNPNSPRAYTSPIPVAKEKQSPFANLSNSSSSKDWLLDSGVKPETVEQQCKFRRLRKLGDLNRKVPSESKEQTGPSKKLGTSKGTDNRTPTKLVKGNNNFSVFYKDLGSVVLKNMLVECGKKKRGNDVAVYIEEEAEVSSEVMGSDNEEDEHDSSSYEDSFIDDGVNPTSVSTQADAGRTDMIAIYRRSLLSQSPFQRLPTKFSPDSVVQSSRMDGSGSSSGAKHDDTPQTGLQSTARISQFACDEIPSEIVETTLDSRKRKLSFYQAQSVPMVNLDKEFSVLSEAARGNFAENGDIFEDDQFYEGIDLDAVEEEAAKLLRQKTECSTQKTATLSEPIRPNLGVMGSPSFDLGV
ncbi:hypothetical protein DH2020_049579 [Rehmannia glutinosa]|uniref:Uncharacterized protein n=1 Tax=Rehmannia glutinosa TaxID=99300 RepID=A0ABR0U368_REHGL